MASHASSVATAAGSGDLAGAGSSPTPSQVLAKSLCMSSVPDGLPPLLPEHEAMAKLRPLMASLKQACGHDRSWAPAVHQLLHHILSTVSRHTRPNQKLFCPCCTSQKNRELFGHYYNNHTLVCKRCSTKFRELVSSGEIRPESNAFHARLVKVMDVNEVGKRKRKSRASGARKRGRKLAPSRAAATAAATTVPAPVPAPRASAAGSSPRLTGQNAPRQGSPGPSKVEEDDGGASAMSSGSTTDSSVGAGAGGGLWGDVTSSDSSDAGSDIADFVAVGDAVSIMDAAAAGGRVPDGLFHDIFDVDLTYSLTDLPLFGAAPSDGVVGVDTGAEDDRSGSVSPPRDGVKSLDSGFAIGLQSMPTLNASDASTSTGSDSTGGSRATGMTRAQLASLVTVTSCVLVPADDGGSEVPLDRAATNTSVPAGSYNLRLSVNSMVPTDCLVSAMVVQLPTEFSTSDEWERGGPVPIRIQWGEPNQRPPTCFKETLHRVTVEGSVTLTSSIPFTATEHTKVAVVAFVTTPSALAFTTYAEMVKQRVAMLPAGGYFDVEEVDVECKPSTLPQTLPSEGVVA